MIQRQIVANEKSGCTLFDFSREIDGEVWRREFDDEKQAFSFVGKLKGAAKKRTGVCLDIASVVVGAFA